MDRDDVLKLHYFREHMAIDHLDRINLDEYIRHNERQIRRDLHVANVKLSLKDEIRAGT